MKVELKGKKCGLSTDPIILMLTIDDIEEARLLFHVFNMNRLKTSIKHGYDYDAYWYKHSDEIAENFQSEGWSVLEQEIQGRGFKL